MSKKKHFIHFWIRSSWHAISRLYNSNTKIYNSTSSNAFTLLNIEEKGTLSRQLEPKIGLEPKILSRIIKSMSNMDLILKKKDPSEKRKATIFLSEKCLKLRKIASHQVKLFNEKVFSKISQEELNAFYKVYDAVNQSIKELKNEK